jgi:hypothetical protein
VPHTPLALPLRVNSVNFPTELVDMHQDAVHDWLAGDDGEDDPSVEPQENHHQRTSPDDTSIDHYNQNSLEELGAELGEAFVAELIELVDRELAGADQQNKTNSADNVTHGSTHSATHSVAHDVAHSDVQSSVHSSANTMQLHRQFLAADSLQPEEAVSNTQLNQLFPFSMVTENNPAASERKRRTPRPTARILDSGLNMQSFCCSAAFCRGGC